MPVCVWSCSSCVRLSECLCEVMSLFIFLLARLVSGGRGGEMCTVRVPASALGRVVRTASVATQVATGMTEGAAPAPATSHDDDDVDGGGDDDDDDVPPDPGGSW